MLHNVSAEGSLASTARAARSSKITYRLDPHCHLGKPERNRLVLDENPPTLHVVLRVIRGHLESAHPDTETFRRLQDLARLKIDPQPGERFVLDEKGFFRHAHVFQGQFTIVHGPATKSLVAARDSQSRRATRHQETRRTMLITGTRLGIGIDDVQLGIITIRDELLAAVDDPFLADFHRLGNASGFPAHRKATSGLRRRVARSRNSP
jgi:hypothetical protein